MQFRRCDHRGKQSQCRNLTRNTYGEKYQLVRGCVQLYYYLAEDARTPETPNTRASTEPLRQVCSKQHLVSCSLPGQTCRQRVPLRRTMVSYALHQPQLCHWAYLHHLTCSYAAQSLQSLLRGYLRSLSTRLES